MSDVHCCYCGEPIDSYELGVDGDMYTPQQKRDFKAGKGCDNCSWGTDTSKKLADDGKAVDEFLYDLLENSDDPDDIWEALSEAWL